MNVCVTGGAGFIGSALVKALIARGDNVCMLTRGSSSKIKGAKVFSGDLIGDIPKLIRFVKGADVIYHCAGEIRTEALMRPLHVEGTGKLLEAVAVVLRETKKPIHWVQLSSVGAYGSSENDAHLPQTITEDSPHMPRGEYEITKTIADMLVHDMTAKERLFSATILRPSNVFGAEMTNQSVIGLMAMIQRGLFFYIRSRTSVATYIHVDDVVTALVLCATVPAAKGRLYNLSNDCLLQEIVDALAVEMKVRRPTLCVPEWPFRILVGMTRRFVRLPLTDERIDALTRRTCYPLDRIKQELGFEPRYAVPAAMANMYRTLKHKL